MNDLLRKDKVAIRLKRAKIGANSRQNDALQSKFAEFAIGQSAAGLAAMHAALAEEFVPIRGHGFVQKFTPAS